MSFLSSFHYSGMTNEVCISCGKEISELDSTTEVYDVTVHVGCVEDMDEAYNEWIDDESEI